MKRLLLNTSFVRATLLSCTLLISQFVVAQSSKTTPQQYIEMYQSMAIDEMDRSGVPASITLAQGILESNCGNSELARYANNHFGIKCGGWTGGEYYKKDDDRDHKGNLIKSCFRVYGSAYESYIDHTAFLAGKQRYAFLFNYPKEDYISWAKGLKTAGYATNPAYAHKLIRVIEENNLSQFDYMTNRPQQLAQTTTVTPPVRNEQQSVVEVVTPTPKETTVVTVPETSTTTPELEQQTPSPNDWGTASFDSMGEIRESASGGTVFPKQYRSGIFTINQVKVVSAKKGDTPYEVAVRYDITVKKLLKFNDLRQGDKLITNQYVFLQRKRGKYRDPKTYHIVSAEDNIYIISQLYGIKLNSLKSRNLLVGKEEPAIGAKIYLNGKAKTKPILRKKTVKRPKTKNERIPKKDIKNFVDEPLAKVSESMKPKQSQQTTTKKSSKSKTDKRNEKRIYDAVTSQNVKTKTSISKEQIELEAIEERTPSPNAVASYEQPRENKTIVAQPTVTTTTISTPVTTTTAPTPVVSQPEPQNVDVPAVTLPEMEPTPTAVQEMSTPDKQTVEVISEYYIIVDEDGNMKKVPINGSSTIVETPNVIEQTVAPTPEPVIAQPVITQTYQTPVVTEEHIIRSEPIQTTQVISEPVGEPFYVEETKPTIIQESTTQTWSEPAKTTNPVSYQPSTHVVKKGDTLYSLSKKYQIKIQTIRDLNGITMNTIKVGQTIRLHN